MAATTLARSSFGGFVGATQILKVVDASLLTVGTSIPFGAVSQGTVIQILPNNQVRVRVTAGPTSGRLLFVKGTAAG